MIVPISQPTPLQILQGHRIIPVVAIDRQAEAVALGQALLAGGIGAIEITLRTAAGLESIRRLRSEVPELIVGVGTLRTPAQVEESVKAGAQFGVAPAAHPKVLQAAKDTGLPFLPGVATPLEIENALDAGFTEMKFFPAEPLGGLPYLKAIAAPYLHWDVRFMPTGGITPQTLSDYLGFERVFAVGGTWIASRELLMNVDWAAITRNAACARAIATSQP